MYKLKIFFLSLLVAANIFASNITVKGILKLEDTNLGAVKINFIDSQNNIFSTETDIYGEFKIQLKNAKYRVAIANYGYVLNKENDILYDFSDSNKPYFLILNAHEKFAIVSGKVVDNNLDPILNSKVNIKIFNYVFESSTDQFGNFSFTIQPGTFTLTAEYPGFASKSIVKKISKASSVTNITLVLFPIQYKISGIITNGVRALPNIPILLYDNNGELLKKVTSSENGYYEFINLNSHSNFYMIVDTEKYKKYSSEDIYLLKDMTDNSIILKSTDSTEEDIQIGVIEVKE